MALQSNQFAISQTLYFVIILGDKLLVTQQVNKFSGSSHSECQEKEELITDCASAVHEDGVIKGKWPNKCISTNHIIIL